MHWRISHSANASNDFFSTHFAYRTKRAHLEQIDVRGSSGEDAMVIPDLLAFGAPYYRARSKDKIQWSGLRWGGQLCLPVPPKGAPVNCYSCANGAPWERECVGGGTNLAQRRGTGAPAGGWGGSPVCADLDPAACSPGSCSLLRSTPTSSTPSVTDPRRSVTPARPGRPGRPGQRHRAAPLRDPQRPADNVGPSSASCPTRYDPRQ